MSSLDLLIKDYISRVLLITFLGGIAFAWLRVFLRKYVRSVYKEYFQSLHYFREKLLKSIDRKNTKKILELRLNQGENLSYYPEGSELFVVSASDERAVEAMKHPGCRWAQVEAHIHRLQHFDNAELDMVVGTGALCRCHQPALLLQEIRRVLAPNGKYLFLEHTREQDIRIWPYICRGVMSFVANFWLLDMCKINTDPVGALLGAGFSNLQLTRVKIRATSRILTLIENQVMGVAIK